MFHQVPGLLHFFLFFFKKEKKIRYSIGVEDLRHHFPKVEKDYGSFSVLLGPYGI